MNIYKHTYLKTDSSYCSMNNEQCSFSKPCYSKRDGRWGKSLNNKTWPSGFAAAITVLSISKCIIISSWYFRCFTHNYTQSGLIRIPFLCNHKIRNCHNIQEIFQPWCSKFEPWMQHWYSSPSHGSTWSVLRSKQTSKLKTISDH